MADLGWAVGAAVLLLGLSTVCWALIGGARLVGRIRREPPVPAWMTPEDVAVLIAAHNEEAVIEPTLAAVRRLVPPGHVFVVSDASTDHTVELARRYGANVLDLWPNRGKAGALVAGLEHFALTRRFEIVMILDADTVPEPDYLLTGLPLFDDPTVAAVAGRATTRWSSVSSGWVGRILLAHRERVYVLFQTLLKYGQAARRVNAVAIVPGFASLYRAGVLAHLDVAAPGLAIEDYNMTFEIHAKRLGRVAFDPSAARATTQDPDTLADYTRQVGRWNLGFWQTVRRHRPRWGVFWVAVSLFAVEVVLSSVLVILVAVAGIVTVLVIVAQPGAWTSASWQMPESAQPLLSAAVAVLVVDLVATCYAAALTRRPSMVLMAPAFTVVRVLDAVLCLRSLAQALTRHSSGVWRSPARRPEAVAAGSGGARAEQGDEFGARAHADRAVDVREP